MVFIKPYLTLLLCFVAFRGYNQQKNYELSKPVDIRQAGVNKVLCMSNGNTLLFHFEPSKGIIIKVFDSARKEIASRRESCRYLDMYRIQDAEFKGLYEINHEAVLFFDQENILSRHILVRLQFSATDGSRTEEKLVAESKSKDKQMNFYVMKNKDEDKYAILFSTVKNYPKRCDIYMVYFNSRHEPVKEVQLDVNRRKYDYVNVAGCAYLDSGVMITLAMSKLVENGTISHGHTYDAANNFFDVPRTDRTTANPSGIGDAYAQNFDEMDPTASIYDHYLGIYYVPEGGGNMKTKIADVSPDVYPYHSFYTYNQFSGAINLLLLGYKDAFIRHGLELLPSEVIQNVLLKLDEATLQVNFKSITNSFANEELLRKKDTGSYFAGLPLAVFTNENGLSTMVSESFDRDVTIESHERPNLFESFLGNICVTQFDDDGNELWGVVLPRRQYYKSYRHYYYINQLSAKWHEQVMFGDLPEQVYNRQFISLNTYSKGKNYYIIYNDDDKNFHNSIEKPGDTVYNFERTNACYYKINSKKEVTKNYLFGTPQRGEYKCSFIEGACFDDKRGVYAALIQYKRGDNISLRMAWSHLDM